MQVRTSLLSSEDDVRADKPDGVLLDLKPHQLTSMAKMIAMEAGPLKYNLPNIGTFEVSSKIGILADLPGYGKTLTALGLVCTKSEVEVRPQHVHLCATCTYQDTPSLTIWQNPTQAAPTLRNTPPGLNLILVKTGVVFNQWLETMKRHTTLKIIPVATKKDVADLTQKLQGSEALDADVVLVSDDFFRDLTGVTQMWCWKRVLIDEPDDVYTVNMPNLNAEFFWLITATPKRLRTPRNRGLIANLCRKELFYGRKNCPNYDFMTVKNTDSYVKKSFEVPDFVLSNYLCKFPYAVKAGLPRRLRMLLNANDLEGALQSLDGQTGDDLGQLVVRKWTVEISNLNIQIDALERQELREREKRSRLEPLQEALCRAETALQNLQERLERLKTDECPICQDEVESAICLSCLHKFCGSCLMQYLQSRLRTVIEEHAPCPCCRRPIDLRQIMRIESGKQVQRKPLVLKQDAVLSILKKHADGRAIIFCNFDATFRHLSAILTEKSIPHEFLTGRPGIVDTVERFRKGDVRVIMLNSRENGSGIDLSFATDIIFYMALENASEDSQALGRAQRVGRSSPLRVHRLYHENELPEDLKANRNQLIVPDDQNI